MLFIFWVLWFSGLNPVSEIMLFHSFISKTNLRILNHNLLIVVDTSFKNHRFRKGY